MYYTVSGDKKVDYRFHRDGSYDNIVVEDSPLRRRKKEKTIRRGGICPSCGLMRSVSNKCDCNS
jgi:hypothetical protein